MISPETAATAEALTPTSQRKRRPTPQLRLVFGPTLTYGDPADRALTRPLQRGCEIGRSSSCDWTIGDPRISGHHAYLKSGEIIDLGSRHGVFLNGMRLPRGARCHTRGGAALAPGDVLRMGESLFVVTPDAARSVDSHALGAGLFGCSPSLATLDGKLAMVHSAQARLLITGPPGVGKELVARAITRRVGQLREREVEPVIANVAAIPHTLQEAALFGVERGAFTGAEPKRGLFDRAAGGVLFLDEIGEASPELQAALLRAVQDDGTFCRVGGNASIRVTAAIVFATNRDLDAEVAAGRFRPDLLSRIRDDVFIVPPVGARREDILPFLASKLGSPRPSRVGAHLPMDADIAQAIIRAHYPGNMRDLVKLAGRIRGLIKHHGRDLRGGDLPALMLSAAPLSVAPSPQLDRPPRGRWPHKDRRHFKKAWEAARGNIPAIADDLGCDAKTVRSWAKKHGIVD